MDMKSSSYECEDILEAEDVYVYVDYTTEKHPRPFYVGKGARKRLGRTKRNACHTHIANKYGMTREIVFVTECEETAFDVEHFYIQHFKTRSHRQDGHWGANHTDGGDGISGWTHSDETRQKISAAHVGRTFSDEHKKRMSETLRGMSHGPLTEQHKKKISKSTTGRVVSDETRHKMSEAKVGKPMSEETKRKISEANKGKPSPKKGKPLSEDIKRKISEAMKGKNLGRAPSNKGQPGSNTGRTFSEETKKRIGAANRGKKRSDETRHKMSEARKRKPFSEETKKKMAEARRQWWAEQRQSQIEEAANITSQDYT